MYEYTVTENTTGADAQYSYSDASYKLRVYVERDTDDTHFVKGYTVVKTADDADAGTRDTKKLTAENFKFINKMDQIADTTLVISKVVDGKDANVTQAFDFTVTLTAPKEKSLLTESTVKRLICREKFMFSSAE